MWTETTQLMLGPNTIIHHHYKKGMQASRDDLACRDSLNTLLNIKNPWNHCRQIAAQVRHSAAWPKTFLIASVGNLLNPDELRIAIALRTGAKNFESTECGCGRIVGELGLHGLSCTKNAGRFPIQSAIHSRPQKVIDPN